LALRVEALAVASGPMTLALRVEALALKCWP